MAAGTKRGTEQEQDAVRAAEIRRAEFRRLYSRLFPRPRDKEEGKPAGIERRRQLCELLKSYDSSTDKEGVRRQINKLLTRLGNFPQGFELNPDREFNPFRDVFIEEKYANLRDIQGNTPKDPEPAGTKRTLKVGPYELQLIYNALFKHEDNESAGGTQAHGFLHDLKVYAILRKKDKVTEVLQKVYDSNLVEADDRKHSNVTLEFPDTFIKQLYLVLDGGQYFKTLEPYEGPCALNTASLPGKECY